MKVKVTDRKWVAASCRHDSRIFKHSLPFLALFISSLTAACSECSRVFYSFPFLSYTKREYTFILHTTLILHLVLIVFVAYGKANVNCVEVRKIGHMQTVL